MVHGWVARHLADRPHPPIKRPINWMLWVTSIVSVLGTLTATYVAWPYIQPVIQSRNLWAIITLMGILSFISGTMFNQIRKVPYVAGDGRGGISYFAGGFQNQYGLETQIVAAICTFCLLPAAENWVLTLSDGILSFAVISLAVKAPRLVDPKFQQVTIIVWGGVLILVYSFLLSVFRMKNGGYPFYLPPFM